MIIIPDIHGHTFWKEAIAKRRKDEMVIFLGDYLDPHNSSKTSITNDIAFDNFLDIVKYKRANPDNCVLLFGNHELSYIFLRFLAFPHDFSHHFRNRRFILDNINLFQLAYYTKLNGNEYLFTHAGVHPKWIKQNFKNIETPFEFYSYTLEVPINKLTGKLNRITSERRPFRRWGSCVWLYISDWINESSYLEFGNCYQIFGHTYLRNAEPLITKYFAALDTRQAYRLSECTGEISMF
ncbi:metallophosphoesterase [Muribaculum intestinale]|uniref:metallophosphoesterase n=1 Tax=Muribaculum intestinale TaxID=1796646 RepID=UPI00242C9AA4|nr:metallophosphoesterase [Muribaculum intestinale]